MADARSLEQRIAEAVEAVKRMTPEERRAMWEAQRRSFVKAEIGFGSDADEAAYARACAHGDEAEIARLESEAAARIAQFKRMYDNG